MGTLEIQYQHVSELRSRSTNARRHSPKQLAQIAASIAHYGFTVPVLVDEERILIAGHGRVEAAKLLGMDEVPTIQLTGLSEAQVRAYVIADNKLTENGSWDQKQLADEFKFLGELDFDFDLSLTGFEVAEIEGLVGSLSMEADDTDTEPENHEGAPVTRLGDMWQIGAHRLICGDSRLPETYAALLGEEKAAMVFADPPYNVKIDGHVCGLGKVHHREFAMASGEMSPEEFTSFLARVFVQLAENSVDGAIHFQCMDWRHAKEILAAGDVGYSELKNICVWSKSNGGMGSLYRSAHELVFVFKSGTAPHINNVELGKNGRYRTNVWSYAGANSFSSTRDQDLSMHPTVKPVAMVADAILDCSRRKDIVLDPFAGSGTTLLAAQKTGRRGYGIELDPIYCDTIVRRMQKTSAADAVLVGNGRTFEGILDDRSDELPQEKAA